MRSLLDQLTEVYLNLSYLIGQTINLILLQYIVQCLKILYVPTINRCFIGSFFNSSPSPYFLYPCASKPTIYYIDINIKLIAGCIFLLLEYSRKKLYVTISVKRADDISEIFLKVALNTINQTKPITLNL
jgi:hypothetical protein